MAKGARTITANHAWLCFIAIPPIKEGMQISLRIYIKHTILMTYPLFPMNPTQFQNPSHFNFRSKKFVSYFLQQIHLTKHKTPKHLPKENFILLK